MTIQNRLVGMKIDTDRWASVLESVLSKYNLGKHISTDMKLIDGKTESNKLLM